MIKTSLNTITLKLNNEMITVEKNTTLATLLDQLGYQDQSFAVAINECFIPRNQYSTTQLNTDDRVEIVTPMQGG